MMQALFVNPQFTRRIVGFKREESDYLLKFLYDHIALGADFQARVKWEKGTVVVWDNRVTAHTVCQNAFQTLMDENANGRLGNPRLAGRSAQAFGPSYTTGGATCGDTFRGVGQWHVDMYIPASALTAPSQLSIAPSPSHQTSARPF